jgi:hypothetical protein
MLVWLQCAMYDMYSQHFGLKLMSRLLALSTQHLFAAGLALVANFRFGRQEKCGFAAHTPGDRALSTQHLFAAGLALVANFRFWRQEKCGFAAHTPGDRARSRVQTVAWCIVLVSQKQT